MARYAVIDIGTVTCRLLVAEMDGGRVRALAREVSIVNLGEGVDASRRLAADAIERVTRAVAAYRDIAQRYAEGGKPLEVLAFATSAARDAANGDELVAALAGVGVPLSIIAGEREAKLSFAGASSEFPGERVLVVDIGGGSTEVVVGRSGQEPAFAHSFDIGCRRVTERFLKSDPPQPCETAAARAWIAEGLVPVFAAMAEGGHRFDRMVAVAGTATTAVSVREAMEVYDSDRVHGSTVTVEDVRALGERFAALPLDQRKQVIGLEPDRASIIVAGMIIAEEVMRAAGARVFTVSESDILQGLVLDLQGEGRAL